MFLATIIVLLMTVPGLALFYGGLVRAKNMLSILMQVFAITCMVSLIWVTYGYSMAFTGGGALNDYVGGFSKAFLSGVTPASLGATFTNGVYIPELAFVAFQMTFACITPALIVGSLAERMKFSSVMLFVALWVTFVYFPMAHMVWYWGGPDVMAEAAQGRRCGARCRAVLTQGFSSSGARSISPAAPSSTSTPVSRASWAR